MMENEPRIDDAAFAKVIILPDGSEGILVGFHTFKVEGVSADWLVRVFRHGKFETGDTSNLLNPNFTYNPNVANGVLSS